MNRSPRLSRRSNHLGSRVAHIAALALVAAIHIALVSIRAASAEGPAFTAVARETREATIAIGSLMNLWQTTWWVGVRAGRGDEPLVALDYSVRFVDSNSSQPTVGSWPIEGSDSEGFGGRIVITCPVRKDYDREAIARMRVRDGAGQTSEWIDVTFPVVEAEIDNETSEYRQVAVSTAPGLAVPGERRQEALGTVEVTAGLGTTMGDAKAELQRKAKEKGGDAAVGFRLVESTDDKVRFAADVIRYVDVVPTAAALPAPSAPARRLPPASERVLYTIAMPATRQ